jgi:flavin reductase (DIM6/NTAB) family NADH-FMN oxidoreductase RutF
MPSNLLEKTTRPVGELRACLGSYPTGVTIVAATHDDDVAGMTLNSFISVSLEPPRVLVSLAHGTRTLAVTQRSQTFTVNVLQDSQQRIARAFAAKGNSFPSEYVGLEGGSWLTVHGALVVFRCRVADTIAVGDHELIVGAVEEFRVGDGHPLVFCRGAFTDLRGAVANRS